MELLNTFLWINVWNSPPKNKETFLILSFLLFSLLYKIKRKWIIHFLSLKLNSQLRTEFLTKSKTQTKKQKQKQTNKQTRALKIIFMSQTTHV